MKRLHWGILATAIGMGGGSAFAQRTDYSKVEIKTTHVAGPVYMLEGRGGNIGVSVGDDGILMVDDQFAPLAEKIKAALRELQRQKAANGKNEKEQVGTAHPTFVLNTHYHGDHVGGNPAFGRDATIVAHTNVRKRLETGGPRSGPMEKIGLPMITFDESLSIHFNGEEIRALHMPHGHTDGDSVIFFTKSNVVHMGDHLFSGMFPFVDLDAGGDVIGFTRNVKSVIDQVPPDVKVIAGHGPLTDLEGLKRFHRMLVETTDIVRSRIAAGETLAQINSAGLPDKWESWGTGFISTERWLETIYESLSK